MMSRRLRDNYNYDVSPFTRYAQEMRQRVIFYTI